jgi:hypothetical protein
MDPLSIIEAIGTIVSSIVSILGLIFIVKQLKQLNLTLRSHDHGAIFSMAFNLNKMLVDNPEFIPVFLENVTIPATDKNHFKAKAIVIIALDFYEYVFEERENLSVNMNATWLAFMQDIYCTNAMLRQLVYEQEYYLDPEFITFIKARFEQMQEFDNSSN